MEFRTPALYRIVHQPIYVGWPGIFRFTPTMTVTQFVFAAMASAWTVAGMWLGESNLGGVHPKYSQYRRRVLALIRSFRRLTGEKPTQSS